jgi:hypothetical protein
MAMGLHCPGANTVVDTQKVLGNDNRIVAIVQTTDQLSSNGETLVLTEGVCCEGIGEGS